MPQYQGVWSLQQQMQALTSGRWATDPLFDYTTLLLQGDAGANGAQNNVFYDTSPNQFAITRNGNTTQGTFSPFSLQPGAWGNYFNGSTDYITTSNANFAMGTSNFTVECWVYLTAYPSSTDGYIATWLNNSGNGFWIGTNSSTGQLAGYVGQGASGDGIAAGVVPLNTWAHTALTRNGSTLTLWLNGVAVGSTTTTRSLDRTPLAIGSTYSSSIFTYKTTGYVSNARVVSGQCLYTGTFTPSTAPFTTTSVGSTGPGAASSLTGTVTLLTSQSNRFIDNSASANTLTISGTPSVQAFSPFAPQFQYTASVTGGSGYFDGTGDWLTTTSSSNLAVGSIFTVEFWFYPLIQHGSSPYFGDVVNSDSGGLQVGWQNSTNWGLANAGVAWLLTTSTQPSVNAWNHMAITRSGTGTNQTSIFLNGARVANGTTTAAFTTTVPIYIGGTGSTGNTQGYVSGLRIVKGSTVYDPSLTTYTVPTAPLTAITNTQLLCNFTNAGILDGTMKNNLETVGNAQISTSVVKYGSGSMYFDGAGDYLRPNSGNIFNFGTGDFTVEFWLYLNSTAAQTFIDCRPGSAGDYILFDYDPTSKLRLYVGSTTVLSGSTLATGQWYHIALARSGSTVRYFINGTQGASATMTTNLLSAANPYIGSNYVPDAYVNGYIDDMRVTKGIARYIANFTPPSVALPRQ